MGLDTLRTKALTYLAARTVRYPVCMDDELREQLRLLQDAQFKAAADAAFVEAHPQPGQPAPKRRTLGDRENAVTVHLRELTAKVSDVLAQAEAADALVVVVFGIPAEAADDPAGWYEQVAGAYDAEGGRSVHQRDIMRDLVRRSYLRTEAPKGEDLGMTYEQARTGLLNHRDLEQLDQLVLQLYREPGVIPFDPASSGTLT